MATRFGGVGVQLPLGGQTTNAFEVQAGEVMMVPPGTYTYVCESNFTTLQCYDPVMQVWRPAGSDGMSYRQLDSDGNNFRVANQTGCPVAALLTNAGTGYTSAPTVTPGIGTSKWVAIMGQLVSSATVTAGGSNYSYAPLIAFAAPPPPGVQATGYATISAGSLTTITITDQGAGYSGVPFISLVNDPRDTTGNNASAVAVMTGLNTVNGVICTDHGYPTGGTLVTLSFSGGGGSAAAALAIMCWTIASYTVTGGGAGYVAPVEITTIGNGMPTNASAYTNPHSQTSFLRTRAAAIGATVTAGGITASAQTLVDGGIFGGTLTNLSTLILQGGAAPTTAATLTLNVGGANDFVFLQPN
jgi:hypothetical protein